MERRQQTREIKLEAVRLIRNRGSTERLRKAYLSKFAAKRRKAKARTKRAHQRRQTTDGANP